MTRQLFVGTTNGLELWVDAQALEKLKQEQEAKLGKQREFVGRRGRKRRTTEQHIQTLMDALLVRNDCWEWQRAKLNGYGIFAMQRKSWRVNRLIYFLTQNPQSMPQEVCHHCDNPACVRPDHLFGGTKRDNIDDMMRKGRQRKGEHHCRAKLTDADVMNIRAIYKKGVMGTHRLAKQYGVSFYTIWCAVIHRTWKHLPP